MPLVVETLKVTVFSGIFPGRSSGINQKNIQNKFPWRHILE